MAEEAVELRAFGEDDFARLIAAIPDARFLLQWAGPEYTYPLDARQLQETLAMAIGETATFKVYKAVLPNTGDTVGHVQLMDIDHGSGTCVLGRVLIFPEHRGKGFGRSMVGLAIDEAFAALDLEKMALRVFTFNDAAIATYRSLGFVRSPAPPIAHPFEGEGWEVMSLELTRERWLHRKRD